MRKVFVLMIIFSKNVIPGSTGVNLYCRDRQRKKNFRSSSLHPIIRELSNKCPVNTCSSGGRLHWVLINGMSSLMYSASRVLKYKILFLIEATTTFSLTHTTRWKMLLHWPVSMFLEAIYQMSVSLTHIAHLTVRSDK